MGRSSFSILRSLGCAPKDGAIWPIRLFGRQKRKAMVLVSISPVLSLTVRNACLKLRPPMVGIARRFTYLRTSWMWPKGTEIIGCYFAFTALRRNPEHLNCVRRSIVMLNSPQQASKRRSNKALVELDISLVITVARTSASCFHLGAISRPRRTIVEPAINLAFQAHVVRLRAPCGLFPAVREAAW